VGHRPGGGVASFPHPLPRVGRDGPRGDSRGGSSPPSPILTHRPDESPDFIAARESDGLRTSGADPDLRPFRHAQHSTRSEHHSVHCRTVAASLRLICSKYDGRDFSWNCLGLFLGVRRPLGSACVRMGGGGSCLRVHTTKRWHNTSILNFPVAKQQARRNCLFHVLVHASVQPWSPPILGKRVGQCVGCRIGCSVGFFEQ
jgi:hypothetical protein